MIVFLSYPVASDQSLLDTPFIESVCVLGDTVGQTYYLDHNENMHTISVFSGTLSNFFPVELKSNILTVPKVAFQ